MDEDRSGLTGLVEKIIKDLNQVLMNHELTEFDIVPLESTRNKSPVLFVQTSLGLESWCVKYVYNYCYAELIRDFFTNPKRRLSRLSNLNFQRIYNLLNPTILINPDVTTLWNKRREMVEKQFLPWTAELHFSKLVLTRKPKCNEAYSYRRWILKSVFQEAAAYSEELINNIITDELNICNTAADKCQNNYHCWEHRIWLMDKCWTFRFNFENTVLYFNEYNFIKEWTANHVSDYSCFHYRQFCLKFLYDVNQQCMHIFEKMMKVNLRENFQKVVADNMINDPFVTPQMIKSKTLTDDQLIALVLGYTPGNCQCYASWNGTLRKLEILFYELVLNEDLIKYYGNHETIWYHRRFLISEIINAMYEYLEIENAETIGCVKAATMPPAVVERKNNCPRCADADLTEHHKKVQNQKLKWFFSCPLFKSLMWYEKALIRDRRMCDKFCEPYEHYIRFFEGKSSQITLSKNFHNHSRKACGRLNPNPHEFMTE